MPSLSEALSTLSPARSLRPSLLAGLALLSLSACATTLRVAEPVGPDPRVAAKGEDGGLIVYTDAQTEEPDDDTYPWETWRPYEILDASHRLLLDVGDNGSAPAEPKRIELYPGTYVVRGQGVPGQGGL